MTSSTSAQHLAHIVKPQPLYPNKSLLPSKPVIVAPTPVVAGSGSQQQQQQQPAAAQEKPQAKSVAQSMLERYKLLPEFESKYIVGDELGSGGFGFVVTAIRVEDQVEVAVKFIFKDKVPVHSLVKDPVLGVIPMEVYILKNMRHPNIIGFHDFFTDKRFYYLVMELHGVPWKKNMDPTAMRSQSAQPPQVHRSTSESAVTGRPPVLGKRHSMDLFECIEANSRLSEDIARKIFGQVVSAVHYLDSYRIVHRDIKDENIVVDQHFNVKIIDFGSALMVPSNGRLFDRFAGTLQYCPPEVLQGHKYRGPEQEVWALGILLYTIMFSGAPFANVSQVLNAEVPIPKYSRGPNAGKPRASEEVIHLLRWMLRKSPSDRANIEQVLTHPWLAK
ncbi:kinase-like domain-containing protein, partial [Catenaria anguillulae PL171]